MSKTPKTLQKIRPLKVPFNWPYDTAPQPWVEELDGFFCQKSLVSDALENEKASELVRDFRITRYELAVLARHYRGEQRSLQMDLLEWGLPDETDFKFLALAGARLATIEMYLGTEEYYSAISSIECEWTEKIAALEEQMRACSCPHASIDDPPHAVCVLRAEETSPLLARHSGITPEQAQLIVNRQPFIGMTLRQANDAFGCLKIREGYRPATQKTEWEVSKTAWGTAKRWLLTFSNGKLESIEDVTEESQTSSSSPD